MNFIKTNPHPAGKKTGDCVVRSLVIAEDKKWLDVYDSLCKIGRDLFEMPNNKKTYETYLTNNGWTKQKMPKHPNGKRYQLRELADERKGEVLVISVARHLATVKSGNLHDTWDCGRKCVGNYFTR
jgi:hypothetical protein